MLGRMLLSMSLLFGFVGVAQAAEKPLEGWLDLQGHRGARGLSPENTIPSFRDCLKHGMTTIELDTTLTLDNQLVVHHDTATNPALCQSRTGGTIEKRRIREMMHAELEHLDCGGRENTRFEHQRLVPGAKILTLPQFFEFVKAYEREHPAQTPARFNIEIKVDETFTDADLEASVKAMVQAIRDAGVVSRTTVQSFRLEILPMVLALESGLTISALFEPSYWAGFLMTVGLDADRDEILKRTRELGATIISPHYLYVTEAFVAKAHALQIKVIPWTVNQEDRMAELIGMGVDGLISDYPNRLKRESEQLTKAQR